MNNVAGRLGGLWRGRRVVLVIIALFIMSLAAILLVASRQNEAPSIVSSAIEKARVDSSKGRYSDAYSKLKAAESQSASDEEKADLYGQIAMAAANSGNTREAIAYLAKKHQVDPSAEGPDAMMLATLYETLDESDNALAQYKAALTFLEAKAAEMAETGELNEVGSATIDSIKARIAELEAQE